MLVCVVCVMLVGCNTKHVNALARPMNGILKAKEKKILFEIEVEE